MIQVTTRGVTGEVQFDCIEDALDEMEQQLQADKNAQVTLDVYVDGHTMPRLSIVSTQSGAGALRLFGRRIGQR